MGELISSWTIIVSALFMIDVIAINYICTSFPIENYFIYKLY